MPIWRKNEIQEAGGKVVGMMRGGSLHALRSFTDHAGARQTADCIVPVAGEEKTLGLLRERNGWKPKEALHVATATPLLVGTDHSLAVPRYEDVITMHECRSAKQLAAVIDQLLPV